MSVKELTGSRETIFRKIVFQISNACLAYKHKFNQRVSANFVPEVLEEYLKIDIWLLKS